MLCTRPAVLALGGLLAMASPARAQDMTGQEIDALVRGKTVYFDLMPGPAGTGVAPYFFGADGQAAIRLPNGTLMRGPWRIDGNAYFTDWDKGPKNSCSRLVKGADGRILSINTADGKPRSTLVRVEPGNPDKL